MDVTYKLKVFALVGHLNGKGAQKNSFNSMAPFSDRTADFAVHGSGLPYFYRIETDGEQDEVCRLFETSDEGVRLWRLNIDAMPLNISSAMCVGEVVQIPFDDLSCYVEHI